MSVFDTNNGFLENLRDLLKSFVEQIIRPVLKYKKLAAIGFVVLSLLFATAELIGSHVPFSDAPLLLLGGAIRVLRWASIFFVILFGGIAYLVYESLFEWARETWARRYYQRHKPKEPFKIPYYRFKIPSVILGVIVFVVLLLPLTYLLYTLPEQNAVLRAMRLLDKTQGDEYYGR